MSDDTTKTSDEIKADIERTRNQMSEKIDTLQERLSPDHLKQQAQTVVQDAVRDSTDALMNYVTENAQQMGGPIVDAIRRNPLPAALIGFGLGWLVFNSMGGNRSNRRQNDDYLYTGYPGERYDSPQSSLAADYMYYTGNPAYPAQPSSVEEYTYEQQYGSPYSEGDLARNLATEGQVMSSRYGPMQGSYDTGEWVDETIHPYEDDPYYTYASPSQEHTFHQTLEDNALLVGAAALGLGIAVGLALPATRREGQLLGDTRDRFVQQAQTWADEVAHEVKQLADDVTPRLEAVARHAVEDVSEVAKDATDPLRRKVYDVATAVEEKVDDLQRQS